MHRSRTRAWILAALALIVAVGLFVAGAGLPTASRPASAGEVPGGFLYREGRNLMLNGQPYRFVGFNAYGMSGCATGQPWGQAQLDDYFATLRPVSMTRTWAFEPLGIAELDRIVAAAEAHQQKLILPLANAGADCDTVTKDNSWYQSGYRTSSYLAWVRAVVAHFANSPAVAIWEIMNEPGNHATVDDATMKAFFDDVAATIKSVDPNHLVGTGSMAEYTPGTRNFGLVHSGPNIDVGSLHEYDYEPASDTLLHAVVSRHLAPTLYAMYKLNKPLIVGETGIASGDNCGKPSATLPTRADAFRQKFDAYLLSGATGALVWNYTPNPGSDNCERIRATPPDPTIAMVHDYAWPTPVTPPATVGALVVRSSGKCLDVPLGATANGTAIDQYPCTSGAAYQRFTLRATGAGFYEIVAQHSGKCLDVSGESLTDAAKIVQWDCWGGANQQFRLLAVGDGFFRFVVRSSVKCLGMTGGTADRGQLVQYTCYATTNYQFKIQA